MNYDKIFIKGLANNQNHLDAYYKRALNKANKKGYTNAEFFEGMNKTLKQVETKLDEPYFKELSNINKALVALENGRFKYPDNGLTDAENYKLTKKSLLTDHKKQAQQFRETRTIPLHLIFNNTYGFTGSIDKAILKTNKAVLKILESSFKIESSVDDIYLDFIKNNHLTTMPTIKERVHNRIAVSAFFKVLKEVLSPETSDIEKKGIMINTTNWNDLKDLFFKQRMEAYDDSLSSSEKIKLESETLEKLINLNQSENILKGKQSQQFNILVDRYKSLLNAPKKETKNEPTFEDFFKGLELKQIKQIKHNFKDLEPKETAILIDLLYNDFKVLNLVHGSRQGKSQKDFIKHITNKTNQSINKQFSKNPLENYVYTGNEADKTPIKKRLQSILK